MLITFLHSKDLLREWTARNIRARYQQSFLGWLWAIIQPATQVAIFSIVFTLFVRVETGDIPYVLFSYVAVVPWTLFAISLPDMTSSLVDNMTLVTKIYFPREVLPVAALLARLFDFAIAAMFIVLLFAFYKIPFFSLGLLYLPLILLVELILIIGIGLMCAALNVFFRDVRSILVLGLQVWFYASPVIYPTGLVPDWLLPYYYLNPMAGIITAFRDVLLDSRLPGPYLWQSLVIALIIFTIGYWLFKRVEFQFADIV